jgi:hypothetical protein
MNRKSILSLTAVILAIGAAFLGGTTYAARNGTITTSTPGVAAGTSDNTRINCSPFEAQPGMVVIGSSGFIMVSCPNGNAFGVGNTLSETPTITLSLGVRQVFIVDGSFFCSFQGWNIPGIVPGTTQLQAENLTSGLPVAFGPYDSTTGVTPPGTLPNESGYNFCLYYTNAPPTGIAPVTISWSP